MFDKIKNAMFYTEPEDDFVMPEKTTAPPTKGGFVAPTGPANPSVVSYGVPVGTDASAVNSGTMKDQIATELLKATEGQAYGKFKQMSLNLKTRIPDNGQRIIATGATLELSGVKSVDILIAARDAVAFLDSEANSFETEAVNDIQNATTELADLKIKIATMIAEKEEQIKKLQEEVSQCQKDELHFESETIKTKGAIEVSRAQFKSAMAQVKAEVEQDIKDVTLYLGGA